MRAWRFYLPLLLPTILQPCSCFVAAGPPCAIQLNAQAVFTGIVVARLPFVYSVHVEDIFSDLSAGTKHLFLDSGYPCASFFELGGRYLFLSTKPSRFSSHLYSAGRCSGTRPASAAREDIAWLRAHTRHPRRTKVFGTVIQNGGWNPLRPLEDSDIPIPNAQVTLAGEGRTYTTLSAPDGSYYFEGIPPGHYRISAQKWPWTSSPWSSLELRKGGCARLLLHLQSSIRPPPRSTAVQFLALQAQPPPLLRSTPRTRPSPPTTTPTQCFYMDRLHHTRSIESCDDGAHLHPRARGQNDRPGFRKTIRTIRFRCNFRVFPWPAPATPST